MGMMFPYYSVKSVDPCTNILICTNDGTHYDFMAYDSEITIQKAIEIFKSRKSHR